MEPWNGSACGLQCVIVRECDLRALTVYANVPLMAFDKLAPPRRLKKGLLEELTFESPKALGISTFWTGEPLTVATMV